LPSGITDQAEDELQAAITLRPEVAAIVFFIAPTVQALYVAEVASWPSAPTAIAEMPLRLSHASA